MSDTPITVFTVTDDDDDPVHEFVAINELLAAIGLPPHAVREVIGDPPGTGADR